MNDLNAFLISMGISLLIFSPLIISEFLNKYRFNSKLFPALGPWDGMLSHIDKTNYWYLYETYFYPHFEKWKFKLNKTVKVCSLEEWQVRNFVVGREPCDIKGLEELQEIEQQKYEMRRKYEESYEYARKHLYCI